MTLDSEQEDDSRDSPAECQYYSADHCVNNKPRCNATEKGATRDAGAYYTSWSLYAVLIALLLLIVSWFSTQNKGKTPPKAFSYTVLPILIGLSANSVGVAFMSRFLKQLPPESSGHNILLGENWFTDHMRRDTYAHIMPMFIALLILMCVAPMKWTGSRAIVILLSISVPTLMFAIWSCVPVPISMGSKTMTNFISKPRYVYGRPSGLVELFLPAVVVLTCLSYTIVVKR